MASSDNYTLGKGVISFNQLKDSVYTGELDLGNCPEFSFSIELEKLEHYSSRGGIKSKDKEVISEISPTVTFSLDEVTKENIALLTLADIEEVTQPIASVTDEEPGGAYAGTMVALANRNITSGTIVVNTSADVLLVEGTDWEVSTSLSDLEIGRIRIMSTYTGVEGDAIKVSYDAVETVYTKLKAISQNSIEGFMRFVSDNPVGNQQELQIWSVSLTPSGDTAMIGDDWSTLAFSGEILKDESGHPDSPYFEIIMD